MSLRFLMGRVGGAAPDGDDNAAGAGPGWASGQWRRKGRKALVRLRGSLGGYPTPGRLFHSP